MTMENSIIYFDNNATTAIAPEVLDAMLPYLSREYANPSSVYPFAGGPARAIVHAREQIASLLGARPEEIIFTSCGTESDNTALRSAVLNQPTRRKIVTSVVEHPAILATCKALVKEGYHVDYLKVDSLGRIDLEEAARVIDDETAIVSVMTANNEIGNIYPVEQLAKIAHQHGAMFHTDAVQAVGKVPINLASSEIDMLSLSGHKLHAPKGIGVLFRRNLLPFSPFMNGGHQESGRRAGTENVASIVGLGKAAELAAANIEHENTFVRAMRDKLEAGLVANCPDPIVNGDHEARLPNTLNICFKYIEGEAILLRLYQVAQICASSGSACTTGSLEPSHVLRALGLDYQALHGSIRFSLSRYNTMEEIDKALKAVPPIITSLRQLSPFGK